MNGENFDPLHWRVDEYGWLIRRAIADGVQVVRLVVRTDQMDRRRFCEVARANGLHVVGVLDRDSIGNDGGQWPRRIAETRDAYAGVIDVWQAYNEADGEDVASWQMSYQTVSEGLRIARATLGPSAIIAGPGLTNSKPWYVDNIDYRPCDFVSVHLYGRHMTQPRGHSFGSPVEVVERYAIVADRPVMVSEWGYLESELDVAELSAQTRAMADFLASHPRVAYAIHFCADSAMVAGFGTYDHGRPTARGRALAASYLSAQLEQRRLAKIAAAARPAGSDEPAKPDEKYSTSIPGGPMAHPVYTEIDDDTLKAIADRGWTPAADPAINRNSKGERVSETTLCIEGAVHYSFGEARFIFDPFA